MAEGSASCGDKRCREDDDVDNTSPSESLDSKRVRTDFFFDILDDESEPDNTDLDSVMRSLEEEISLPIPLSDTDPVEAFEPQPESDPKQPDLGFLLEASDDELGLPPAESSEVTGGEVTPGEETLVSGADDVDGKIWGLDDEIHLDFGFGSGDNGFDYDGGACGGPVDFPDLTWQPEYLPAV